MGFGDFLKKAVNVVSPVKKAISVGFGAFGGLDDDNAGSALLSGIPFLGQGFAQEDQQQFNAQQAQLNRDFQQMMSSSAHQRQVTDLRKAGLNPILSVNSGAATPSGSAASSAISSGAGDAANIVKDLMNLSRDKAKTEIDLLKQQKKTSLAEEHVKGVQKTVMSNTADKLKADTMRTNEDTQFIRNRNKIESVKGDFY